MNFALLIIFLGFLSIIGFIHIISKKIYKNIYTNIDIHDFRMKKFINVGLYFLEKTNYKFCSKYDNKIMSKVSRLWGYERSGYYLKIYLADKITTLMFLSLVLLFISIFIKFNVELIVFSFVALICVSYGMDKELDNKINKRRFLLEYDFPDFLNKLILLINSGMTTYRAWEQIALTTKKQSYLNCEIRSVVFNIKNGKSEQQAYEEFARKCRTPQIAKFISVIIQNLNKGNADLSLNLRVIANECWEVRKNSAKRLGEEASTKMLIPMVIMFIAILIIVITPAILSLKEIIN